jgi:hypothetical protein
LLQSGLKDEFIKNQLSTKKQSSELHDMLMIGLTSALNMHNLFSLSANVLESSAHARLRGAVLDLTKGIIG